MPMLVLDFIFEQVFLSVTKKKTIITPSKSNQIHNREESEETKPLPHQLQIQAF